MTVRNLFGRLTRNWKLFFDEKERKIVLNERRCDKWTKQKFAERTYTDILGSYSFQIPLLLSTQGHLQLSATQDRMMRVDLWGTRSQVIWWIVIRLIFIRPIFDEPNKTFRKFEGKKSRVMLWQNSGTTLQVKHWYDFRSAFSVL